MKNIVRIFLITYIIIPLVAFGGIILPNNAVPFPDAPAPEKKSNTSMLTAAYFPSVYTDASFTERLESKQAGYEPFKDMSAYRGIVIPGEEHYTERELAKMEIERQTDAQTMSDTEYCAKYPLDETRCPQDAQTLTDVINTGSRTHTSDGALVFTGRTIGGGPVVAKKDTFGGSCYPAARDKVFKNKILTTGQYENISPAFEKAMITLFRKEGKCGIIKNDPCGYTCYGISTCTGLTEQQIHQMTRADAEDFYYDRYWKKYNIDKLPDVIAGDIFLAGMGSGPQTAIQQFRTFLKLPKNGAIDDDVIMAIARYDGDIHNDWLDTRQKFLTDIAAKRYQNSVLRGWMNGIRLKRNNGCHVIPSEPLYRQ